MEQRRLSIALLAIITLIGLVTLVAFVFGIDTYQTKGWMIVAFLVISVIFSIRLSWGPYAMALFLPLINWNFSFGPLVIPFIDVITLATLIGFVLHTILHKETWKDIKLPFFIPFILFWGATAFSSIFSPHPLTSFWYSIRWILFLYVGYVAIPFNIIRSKKILKGVLISFIISGFIMAVMGVISIKDQNIFYDPFRFTVLTINGAKPFGLDQNLLVETLLPAIFFLLAIRLWPRQSVKYKLTVLLLLFFGLVLLGTFSRGAWISILVCSVLYLLYQKKLNLQKLIIGGSMVMVLLLPLFIHMYQLQTNYKVGIGSTQTRWLSTQIAWKTFKDNIWVGRGTGEYENMLNDSIRFRARHGLGTDSNGIFQKVMAENGLIGLVTLTILVITIFRHLYIQLRKQTESNDFVLPIYLAALSIFIFEMVNTSYYHGKLWLPIAIALSASAIVEKK